MFDPRKWGVEVFGALLPLLMGGFVIFLADGDKWWDRVVGWVADGTLMPPAALLAFALILNCHEFVAPNLKSVCEAALIVLVMAIVMVFMGSVQRENQNSSAHRWATINGILYLSVVTSCFVMVTWRQRAAEE